VTAEEQAAMLTACQAATPEFDVSSLDDTLIDRRGSIAALTAVNDDALLTCSLYVSDGSWYSFGAGVETGGHFSQPSLSRAWNSEAEINIAHGVAIAATNVEVDAPDLPTATATVLDGRYIVWLPQSFDWSESTAGIQIRYLDENGQTLQSFDL
jgi:hypothetical protein